MKRVPRVLPVAFKNETNRPLNSRRKLYIIIRGEDSLKLFEYATLHIDFTYCDVVAGGRYYWTEVQL